MKKVCEPDAVRFRYLLTQLPATDGLLESVLLVMSEINEWGEGEKTVVRATLASTAWLLPRHS